MSTAQPLIGDGTFRVGRRCSPGDLGPQVFEGTNIINGQLVALKFEWHRATLRRLHRESKSYKMLEGLPGFPQVYYFGRQDSHHVLVMDMLGPNLDDLFHLCGRNFSVKTVCMLAKQMITRLQAVHERSLLYRNIQDNSFLMGRAQTKLATVVHLVDFGHAKPYRDLRTGVHIPYRESKPPNFPARYMSINGHFGREQSRRDDLESLGYLLLHFLRGSLPWQGVKAQTSQERHEKVAHVKSHTKIRDLCAGLPQEVATYLEYARGLSFEETPDYDSLRALFTKILRNRDMAEDDVYDWEQLDGAGKMVPGTVILTSKQNLSNRVEVEQHRQPSWIKRLLCCDGKKRRICGTATRVRDLVTRPRLSAFVCMH